MPQARKKLAPESPKTGILIWRPGAIFAALLASLVVQMFRVNQHRWVPAIWMEFAVLSLVPVCMFLLLRRWERQSPTTLPSVRLKFLVQGGICFSVLLLIVWQGISRTIGLGDANEVIALLCLQTIGLFLAVFASIRGFEKTSILLCGALVFFVCCMTNQMSIFIVGAIFAASTLWWLAGIYWSRLDSKAIDGHTRMLGIHGFSIGFTTLAIALAMGVALVIPISRGQISVAGFMPFSGGENGYQDDFAASGVGDGNMLTAGNNATTTGAVDSNQFIEDHNPSMYDVVSEKYDGPVFKKTKRNKTVALSARAKHLHDLKQSEQSGRSFRTMRKTGKPLDIELEERITKALFFVEGSAPARFAVDSFHVFDGWDWSKADVKKSNPRQPRMVVQNFLGEPIFKLSRTRPDYLAASRRHKIKIMRFQNATLPAPSFLDRWHIDFVDNLSFFDWNESGHVQYNGDFIPQHTVIDVGAHVPNYHVMRSANGRLERTQPSSGNANSPYLQLPESGLPEELDRLVQQYAENVRPGWNQVEAIVNGVREDFELNPNWEVDETVGDTISHFVKQKGGPSWMFATTCAMALRDAGYRTRLASGFLVRKQDYDRIARQSVVTSENAHMWPEVCLDGKYWIPVEPTPGFPVPYSTETLWQWMTAKAYGAIYWIWSHPIASSTVATMTALTWLYRAHIVTYAMLLWWHLIRLAWPTKLLRTTRQLVDLRFWAAGHKRPLSCTIKNWYTRVEPGLSTGFFELWNLRNFCSTPPQIERSDLVSRCREQIESLTLEKIQNFVTEANATEKS